MGRPQTANPAPSTERGRKHRERQRDGYRVYPTPMHEDGLTMLIASGFLRDGDDADDCVVGQAIGAFIAAHFDLKEPSDDSFKRVRLNRLQPM
jgi:hypothetical protein